MDAGDRLPARVGRKRDPSRDVAILDATLDVLAEAGFRNLTIGMVAAAAGAGKATVYRRWPTKADLVLDAVSRLDNQLGPGALPDTGTLRGDLHALLDSSDGVDSRRFRIMAGLTSMLADHPGLGEAVDKAIIEPWATANLLLIQRAVARGEAAADADAAGLARVVPTMAAYRACVQRRPIPNAYIEGLIDHILLPALAIA
ncbi:TetR/AcrR family transcriptional regulator [Micromonospora palythoicola]|uniref:TetR/AcrR family transcriptional regulator n=1 Tax=Micromonospora palythoicola TaxID=3120507 RepID=UPI002FCE21C8